MITGDPRNIKIAKEIYAEAPTDKAWRSAARPAQGSATGSRKSVYTMLKVNFNGTTWSYLMLNLTGRITGIDESNVRSLQVLGSKIDSAENALPLK